MIDAQAVEIARAITQGTLRATDVVMQAIERIRATDREINSFTSITEIRAMSEARSIDERRARGEVLPPLAGVPYAVKNLFDVEGEVTLAGSVINRERKPAAADAFVVGRMRSAGAILVGALNMDEYAFGFTTENTHYGPTRNPHDTSRIAGGSSGGSAAAVAAGMVPVSLGSDTNGSIRVPASLCGVFGLKPTFGRLSRRGAYPLAASFDHVGPFARSVADLAACYDALQGPDPQDPACAQRALEPCSPVLGLGSHGLRVGVLGGYFEENAGPESLAALQTVQRALACKQQAHLPEAARARAAATLILTAEAAALHYPDLQKRPQDFDPQTRDRLLAGALIPALWSVQAQRFRRWFLTQALELFRDFDVLIAPATPWPATRIGEKESLLNGRKVITARDMGLLTSPISFIGLPAVVAPVHARSALPVGVQLIAAPWKEVNAIRVAAQLEQDGICTAPVANGYMQ